MMVPWGWPRPLPRRRRISTHAALKELKEARKELKEADHDFGGYRVEAIEAIDKAIVQLEKALKLDKSDRHRSTLQRAIELATASEQVLPAERRRDVLRKVRPPLIPLPCLLYVL